MNLWKKSTAVLLVVGMILSLCTVPSFAQSSSLPDGCIAGSSLDFANYDFSDPSQRIENFPTDEEFFGLWNQEMENWEIAPKLNYAHVSIYGGANLLSVEENVKSGDYESAKAELLAYYREMNHARGLEAVDAPDEKSALSMKLLAYNIYYNPSAFYSFTGSMFEVENSFHETSIDLLSCVSGMVASEMKQLPIMIAAVTKDGCEAEFYSKEGEQSLAPTLRVVVNGMEVTLTASDDTYVSAGDNANKNYGSEGRLYAYESEGTWRYPVNSETKRTYIMFDLSGFDKGDTISSATLTLHGKYSTKKAEGQKETNYQKPMVAMVLADSAWSENNLYYAMNTHSWFSYGDKDAIEWIMPADECRPHFNWDETLFRLDPWLRYGAYQYSVTKDETYALTVFLQLHNFIEETYNVYRGMPGDYALPKGESYSSQLIGGGYSKSLDLSVRASSMAQYLRYYYDSPYMTGELFCVFLKYIWSMGDLLSRFYGPSERGGNWGAYSNWGFFTIAAYYPEFAARDAWMETLSERFDINLSDNVLTKDGASIEGAMGYVNGSVVQNFTKVIELAEKMQIDPCMSDATKEKLGGICQYLLHMMLPWGGDPQIGDSSLYSNSITGQFSSVYNITGDENLKWWVSGRREGKEPEDTSKFYDDKIKRLIMRSDWSDDALYLHTSGHAAKSMYHSHWDDLAIISAAYGKYLLIDPLRYSYTVNDLSARWLISTRGHNTLMINDYDAKSANPTSGDTSLPIGGSPAEFSYLELNDSYDFVRMTTENYKNITYRSDPTVSTGGTPPPTEPGADVSRNILFVRPNFWIVSDYMKPVDEKKTNKYTQLWHFLPEANISIDGQYTLKDGEKTGNIASGELNTQIENTEFIRGTGNGSIRTNNIGEANMTVVPVGVDSLEPKLLRGLAATSGTGGLKRTAYGVFEKYDAGTTGFDTILYPTPAGRDTSVSTKKIALGLPKGAASAFSANVKENSGMTNDDYNFTYFILHETDKQGDVKIAKYQSDPVLLYFQESNSGAAQRLILKDGTYLTDGETGRKIFYSLENVEDVSVEWDGKRMALSSSKDVDWKKLTVYSPNEVKTVTINNEEVDFTYQSNYVYFGERPLLAGNGADTENDNSGAGSGNSAGKGGGASHGSSGATAANLKPVVPSQSTKTIYDNELSGHWAQREIRFLLDNAIVKGDGKSLNLKNDVSRAEFITMLARAVGLSEKQYDGGFFDVSKEAWYADVLQAAYEYGIFEGDFGFARPEEKITREQATKMLMSALEKRENISYSEGKTTFDDDDKISEWAKKYVTTACDLEIVGGIGENMFSPKGFATREQAMVLIYRLIHFKGEE